jgi:hypothetical protein
VPPAKLAMPARAGIRFFSDISGCWLALTRMMQGVISQNIYKENALLSFI